MPDAALNAFIDRGKVARTIDADLKSAQDTYDKIEKLGIHWSDVGSLLELEGVASFKKSFNNLIKSLTVKADALAQSNQTSSLCLCLQRQIKVRLFFRFSKEKNEGFV
jgi:transaldolase